MLVDEVEVQQELADLFQVPLDRAVEEEVEGQLRGPHNQPSGGDDDGVEQLAQQLPFTLVGLEPFYRVCELNTIREPASTVPEAEAETYEPVFSEPGLPHEGLLPEQLYTR